MTSGDEDDISIRELILKLDAINHLQIPRNKSGLKSFLGMVTYHTKFIPALQEICRPLYQLASRRHQRRTPPSVLFINCPEPLKLKVHILTYYGTNRMKIDNILNSTSFVDVDCRIYLNIINCPGPFSCYNLRYL
ncbi:hypothetical protein GJ496_005803 [Pomphorhynchus laevis]|nr:hypothetical protein GJ496_005803 [Pomphorhynchus laevis]